MGSEALEIDPRREPENPFEFLLSATRHGDAIKYAGQTGFTYLLNHPRYVKEVLQNSERFPRTSMVKLVLGDGLLASDGQHWREQRQLMQALFHRSAVARLEHSILRHTNELVEHWEDLADVGDPVDVASEMTRLTLSIIVDALFGARLGASRMQELCGALDVLLDDLGAMLCSQLNTPLTFSRHSRTRFQTAMRVLDGAVAEIVDQGRRSRRHSDNLLSLLLSNAGRRLSDRQIRDEVVTMLIAGHETTALILSWGWQLLSVHSSVEESLHEELDRRPGSSPLALADLNQLPFTLMILRESMRLNPPVWLIARKSSVAGDVAGCHVPADVVVVTSPYAIHRHPGFWKDPNTFEPCRFADGGGPPDKFTYIPFGGGRHLCLGMHLALVEGHLILARLAQRFIVRPVPNHPVEPRISITFRMRDGLPSRLYRRAPERNAS